MNEIKVYEKYAVMVIKSRTYGEIKVLISLEDVERVNARRWGVSKSGRGDKIYVTSSLGNGKLYLHRYIMGNEVEDGKDIDHIDGNTFNNTRANLRIVTRGQNNMNSRARSKTGVKNVQWDNERNKWRVLMKVDGKYCCKRFDDFEKAIYYRNQLLYSTHGEYANYGQSYYLYDVTDIEQVKELEQNGFHYIKVVDGFYKFLLTNELKQYLGYVEE